MLQGCWYDIFSVCIEEVGYHIYYRLFIAKNDQESHDFSESSEFLTKHKLFGLFSKLNYTI